MGGHDGRSALRDRFRGNGFDGNGELDCTGRCAVQFGNRGDLGDLSHRNNIHEKQKTGGVRRRMTRESACFKDDSRFNDQYW
ncbi:hypothetical protein [Paraburkholderia sp. BR10954]|uniref:hypothetical protein n=1 Tax=Paraburkholderia sp. BR10954 TaxID=3236995 RepID=UPI0034D18CA3